MKIIYLKKVLPLLLTITLFVSCSSSSGGGDDDTPPPPAVVASPAASLLIFPVDNTECNTGVVINDNQSNVTFEWNTSENTDSYELNVTNLNTNTTTKSTSNTNESTILVDRGTPYEWFVISKANGTTTTATSTSWRFYNEGPGIENYAPFPAEAVKPGRGSSISSTGLINLEWETSDIDNDIESFEVFFGTSNPPTESLGVTVEYFINDVITTDDTIYYWQVITRDEKTNASTSEVFQFKTQ